MAFKTLMLVLDVKKCTLSIVVVQKVGMDWYISVEIFQHEKKVKAQIFTKIIK